MKKKLALMICGLASLVGISVIGVRHYSSPSNDYYSNRVMTCSVSSTVQLDVSGLIRVKNIDGTSTTYVWDGSQSGFPLVAGNTYRVILHRNQDEPNYWDIVEYEQLP